MGFQVYSPLSEKAINVVLKSRGVPKWDRRKPELRKAALKEAMIVAMSGVYEDWKARAVKPEGVIVPVDVWTVCDEQHASRVNYFVEDPTLLDVLWNARMQVSLSDFDLTKFPTIFTVAWPVHQYQGVQLKGCLVTVARRYAMHKVLHAWMSSLFSNPFDPPEIREPDPLYVWIATRISEGVNRVGLSEADSDLLMDEDRFEAELIRETQRMSTMGMVGSLDAKDAREAYVLNRLVLRLLVYMQARPDLIHEGPPDTYTLAEPGETYRRIRLFDEARAALGGTHASPGMHWRNEHFRRYPVKEDGTRKLGAVHVKGTVVMLDGKAKTVKEADETAAGTVRNV